MNKNPKRPDTEQTPKPKIQDPPQPGEEDADAPATSRLKKVVTWVSVVGFVAFLLVLSYFIGKPIVEMVGDGTNVRDWIDQNAVLGRLAFFGLVVLQVIVAFIPGEPLEIAAGYVFGPFEGTLICLAGIAVGSALIFLFVKKIGIRAVRVLIPQGKLQSLRFINNARRLNMLIFILFFIPGTPKDLFTYVVGLTPMKLAPFLLISSIARIPSVITSTIGGNALHMKDFTFAIVVFVITGVVSAVGLILYNRYSKKRNAELDEQDKKPQQKK